MLALLRCCLAISARWRHTWSSCRGLGQHIIALVRGPPTLVPASTVTVSPCDPPSLGGAAADHLRRALAARTAPRSLTVPHQLPALLCQRSRGHPKRRSFAAAPTRLLGGSRPRHPRPWPGSQRSAVPAPYGRRFLLRSRSPRPAGAIQAAPPTRWAACQLAGRGGRRQRRPPPVLFELCWKPWPRASGGRTRRIGAGCCRRRLCRQSVAAG